MKTKTLFLAALLVIGQSLNLFATDPIAQEPTEGDGSEGEPYRIGTLANLYWVAVETRAERDFAGEYFLQTDDIDAAETAGWFDDNEGWRPMGVFSSLPFSGNYDGGGHTISNLHIERPEEEDVSLFGFTVGATISNLGLTNVAITGGVFTGGITGEADYTEISNCSVSGSIEGGNIIGGISGMLDGGQINNSYNLGDLSGIDIIGGLVGEALEDIEIRNSYSAGSINVIEGGLPFDPESQKEGLNTRISRHNNLRDQFSNIREPKDGPSIGGVIGYLDVGTITNCFFDYEAATSLGADLDMINFGATGKTTAEMKDINTFSDWDISPNPDIPADYPFLAWELDENGEKRAPVWIIGTGTGDPVAVPLSNIALYLSFALIAGFVFFRIYRIS